MDLTINMLSNVDTRSSQIYVIVRVRSKTPESMSRTRLDLAAGATLYAQIVDGIKEFRMSTRASLEM